MVDNAPPRLEEHDALRGVTAYILMRSHGTLAVELAFYCFVSGRDLIGWLKKADQWVQHGSRSFFM